jgi:protein-S-isoprenylcysteine O-methyltransferase Ste14
MSSSFDRSARPAIALSAQIEAGVYEQRNLLAGLPVALAWLSMPASASPAELAAALALVAAGGLLRAWGTLHNRYAQGEAKTLTSSGPYSWLRNPLYVANTLVILGGVAAAGLVAWLPLALLWCALAYELTVRHEERRLRAKYGAAYQAYCDQVGRWLPRRLGETPREPWRRFGAALLAQAPVLLVFAPVLLRLAL